MEHGGNIYKVAKKLKCKSQEIVDFSSNINSYHPNIDITLTNTMLVPYAETSYKTLKQSISKKYDVKKKQIALYNGATSAIYELLKSLKEDRVYLYAPMYGEYEKASKQAGKKIYKINRFDEMYKGVKKGSIVVFVNPSTPDGKFYKLEHLFTLWQKMGCSIIIDESFLEFESLKTMRNQINSYKKLYILQSFTKFHACAGVRIGAIFSNKENIQKLVVPIWNLSSFDVEFLSKRLSDKKFALKSKEEHKKNKKELYDILKRSGLFSKIYSSSSNFFLVKSKRAKEIYKHLLKHKILVRTCGSFDFLTNSYLRFAVKDSFSHKLLQKVIRCL